MYTLCSQLLNENDPAPVTLQEGRSALFFTGPHNGKAVPETLPCALGMDEDWFQNAHEASDLHVDSLFEGLQKRFTEATFLAANYSRLVCDLNAAPDYAVSRHSPENPSLKIPHNQPECCCMQERLRRLTAIYTPYHDTKRDMIEKIRRRHGGVIALDIHSFSPTWQGKPRAVEIGTIRCEKTPLSYALEEFWRNQSYYRFISGEPYRVAQRPSNIAPIISESSDLQYIGIEIRSDLIDRPEKRKKMVEFLGLCVDHLQKHVDLKKIMAKRSDVVQEKAQTEHASWSI